VLTATKKFVVTFSNAGPTYFAPTTASVITQTRTRAQAVSGIDVSVPGVEFHDANLDPMTFGTPKLTLALKVAPATFVAPFTAPNVKWLKSTIPGDTTLYYIASISATTAELHRYIPAVSPTPAIDSVVITPTPLNISYFTTPATLLTASLSDLGFSGVTATLTPVASSPTATYSVIKANLTVHNGGAVFAGPLMVTVVASDGTVGAAKNFFVNYQDAAPQFTGSGSTSILSHVQIPGDTVILPGVSLTAPLTDGDGDVITPPSTQTMTLNPNGTVSYSTQTAVIDPSVLGLTPLTTAAPAAIANAKWLKSTTNGGTYYVIPVADPTVPSRSVAELHQFTTGKPIVGLFNLSYYQDVTNFARHVSQPYNGEVTFSYDTADGKLKAHFANDYPGYTGSFRVRLTISDGTLLTVKDVFVLLVDHAPTFTPVTSPVNAGSNVNVGTANDLDGDHLNWNVSLSAYDPLYELNRQFNFSQSQGLDYSRTRPGALWFYSQTFKQYYALVPTYSGGVVVAVALQPYSATTGVGTAVSTGLVTSADLVTVYNRVLSDYNANPSTLTNSLSGATTPPAPPTGVTYDTSTGSLLLFIPNSLNGKRFRVFVTVDDGLEGLKESFTTSYFVNVINP